MADPRAFLAVALVSVFHVGDSHTPGRITASGHPVTPGVTVACPRAWPLGTAVEIAGVGVRVCEDRFHSRYEGGPVRLDVAVEPGPLPKWTGERGYRLLAGEHTVRTWYRDALQATCQSAPTVDGTYLASHCLPVDPGVGWTVYVGFSRVTQWSLDPTRDLAHVRVGEDASVRIRPPRQGETATSAGRRMVEHGRVDVTVVGRGPANLRAWCAEPPGLKLGTSGSGVYGEDGALIGVLVAGGFSGGVPVGDPSCGGRQRMLSEDVP